MIHICYGLYDRDGHYSKFVGTSMASVFENTQEDVTVHILHDNTLTGDNRDKFIYLVGKYGRHVEFYNVETLANDQVEQFKSNLPSVLQSEYSIATLYRLLMPKLILPSVSRIIYLDADILVNLDIAELWETKLLGLPAAVVPEHLIDIGFNIAKPYKYLLTSGLVKEEEYFNAGVLLFDLEYLRNNDAVLADGYKFLCEHPQCKYFDQDILNYCFAARSVKLPAKFDQFVITERLSKNPRPIMRTIYHYTGNSIQLDLNERFNRLYFEYFVKTPWLDINALGNVFKAVDAVNKMKQNALLGVIRLIGKKKRAFFIEEKNIPVFRALFEIADNELIIDASNSDALMKMVDALKTRKTVCFIISGNYSGFRNFLLSQHFVEGTDFIDALSFVSGFLGIQTESHSIVRAM